MSLINKILYKKIGKHYLADYLICTLSAGPVLGCIAGTVAGACYGIQSKDVLEEFTKTEYYHSQTVEEDIALSILRIRLGELTAELDVAYQQLENGEISPSEFELIYENYNSVKDNYDQLYAACTSDSRPDRIMQRYINSVEAGEIVETSESIDALVAEYKKAINSGTTAGWTACGFACAAIPAGAAAYIISRSDLLEPLPYDSSY